MQQALTRAVLLLCVVVLIVGLVRELSIKVARADGTPWFSTDQVNAGRLAYGQNCAVCHGAKLADGGAPALTGSAFDDRWNGKTVETLYQYVSQNMPLGRGGSLKPQTYADIIAYLLSNAGIAAGTQTFMPSSPMDRVLQLSAHVSGPSTAVAPSSVVIGKLFGPVVQPSTHGPTQAELDAADASTIDWLMYNKGYRGERYSTLRADRCGECIAGSILYACSNSANWARSDSGLWSRTKASCMRRHTWARTQSMRRPARSFGAISTSPKVRR